MARPTLLMILDGWGCRNERDANAVALARTPFFDRLLQSCPHARLTTFGPQVGLPEGQMGNSEVGHLNIGAGRIVLQMLPRIDRAIARGDIAAIVKGSGLVDSLSKSGGRCHVAGLLSDGGVHSHRDHALALTRSLAKEGIEVVIHAFTDGRDTSPESANDQIRQFEAALPEDAVIGTVSGRYFAMDRDKRWDRVAKAYSVMVDADGRHATSATDAIDQARRAGETDEFITPTALAGYTGMTDGDALVFFNFRADRARQILQALTEPGFEGFSRNRRIDFCTAVGMVSYGDELDPFVKSLFPPDTLGDGLSETVSRAGLSQLHMAETEKYPHVTYFLNGGREEPFPGEERILVPSPAVATYDLQPEMSAPELTDRLVAAIVENRHDFIVVNYANPDMVGHTGSLEAAITAVEAVDRALGRVLGALDEVAGQLVVIADHGNCEEMIDSRTGQPHTAHTLNPVPVIVRAPAVSHLRDGILADVAPTLLHLMGLEQPEAMNGRSLIAAER